MRWARPGRASFEGRVVARWIEDDPDPEGWRIHRITLDDASGTQTFVIPAREYRRVAIDDQVRLTVDPRSGRLIDLTVTQRPRPLPAEPAPASPPADPLLTDAEAAALVGTVRRSTAIPSLGGYGVIFKGRDGTLSLTVARGRIAEHNIGRGRESDIPIPGAGDEAWLLDHPLTAMVRVGADVAKLTVRGNGAHGTQPLCSLVALVAARLAAQASPASPPANEDHGT